MRHVKGLALLVLLPALFLALGCQSGSERLTEAIGETESRIAAIEDALTAIEEAPEGEVDAESRAAAEALREQLEHLEAWLAKAEGLRASIEGEDAAEVGENVARLLSSSGVPYAGLVAALLGGFGAWSRERKRTDQLIRNVQSSGVVKAVEEERRRQLEALNVATGLESRIERVKKGA